MVQTEFCLLITCCTYLIIIITTHGAVVVPVVGRLEWRLELKIAFRSKPVMQFINWRPKQADNAG